jgi:hypothetical protein
VQIETGAYRDAVIVDRGTVPAQKVFDGETSLGHLIFRRRGLAQGDVVQAVTRTFERGSQA